MHAIPNFPGYKITPSGRIFNRHGRRLTPYNNPVTGYAQISLTRDGERHCTTVHRLLAETFLNNPAGKEQVNHVDGDKLNNHAANLEWVTAQENVDHAHARGLYRKNKAVAYQLHPRNGSGVGYVMFRVAGIEEAGFNPSNVMNVIKKPTTPGGRRRHVNGYYPSRVEY